MPEPNPYPLVFWPYSCDGRWPCHNACLCDKRQGRAFSSCGRYRTYHQISSITHTPTQDVLGTQKEESNLLHVPILKFPWRHCLLTLPAFEGMCFMISETTFFQRASTVDEVQVLPLSFSQFTRLSLTHREGSTHAQSTWNLCLYCVPHPNCLSRWLQSPLERRSGICVLRFVLS